MARTASGTLPASPPERPEAPRALGDLRIALDSTDLRGRPLAITDAERHRLHTKLDQVLGEEDAAVLISHLPPSGWSDVARTRDLDELEHRLTTRMDASFEVQDARIDARFAALDTRFAEMDTRFAETNALLQRELRRHTIAYLTITSVIVTLVVTLAQLATP